MDGSAIIDVFSRHAKARHNMTLDDEQLAEEFGISVATLRSYRNKELTPAEVAKLIEAHGRASERRLAANAIVPIIEFLELEPTPTTHEKTYQIFSTQIDGKISRYLNKLRERLQISHGIYVFHDSRGRAIYAGKAVEQSLWKEMNNAFNRDRKEVQSIKRAYHPVTRGHYGGARVRIQKEVVALHDIATYASAYEVPDELISKFEALIVRSFANDLLNVRMETL